MRTVTSCAATRPMALYTSSMPGHAPQSAPSSSASAGSFAEHDGDAQSSDLGRLAHDAPQLLQIERLVEVVERAALHRLDRRVRRLRQGHEDDGDARVDRADALEDVEAGAVGQPQVEKDDVGRMAPNLLHAVSAACRHRHPMGGLGERLAHLLRQQHGVIVDEEYVEQGPAELSER